MFVENQIKSNLETESKIVTLEEFWEWYPDGYIWCATRLGSRRVSEG